jgi:NADH-quinone oxidoreductase subunit A
VGIIKERFLFVKFMRPIETTNVLSPFDPGIFSLVVYGLVVFVLIGMMLFLSAWLGEKRSSEEKLRPYESGIIPTGTARLHHPVPFYLVAIFFLLFDVEGIFIFSYAVCAKELSWLGWFKINFFIMILLLGLAYIWRKGGLDWGPARNDHSNLP